MSEEEQKQMMAYYYRKQEAMKVMIVPRLQSLDCLNLTEL